ncbi:restriction endonuclease subunit S [Bifidobacterium pseudocatenulatum]|uniref:restriction endonuclease subunit S n=1 Tax=Bifidobacterium pseudocatenulatum TaxID=28026 RepID=UPI000E4C51F8|nr:restriction endonuclease subunit S [Bifidobacterium pseudocatenulatum]RHJ35206.1 restriction endonuclease subunit S [Bifidobacterium pseudocatenulatum]
MMVAPKLRFKADDGSEFPAWEKKTLGNIVERVTRKNRDNQTDVPLTISSLDGLVDQRDYFKKTVASKDMSGYFLLQNGEFAYNKSYSVGFDYGSIKRLDRYPCGALSTLYICFGLKPNVDIDSDYLTHYFDSQKWNSEVAAICAEGARNHGLLNVSTSDFFDINIMSPSLPEQRKISDFLSAVDAVIAAQQAEVDAWEQRKKGVMQKLFSQEVRFKADDGSDFPDWEEKTLGELCSPLTYGMNAAATKFDGENRYIRITDIDDETHALLPNDIVSPSGELDDKYLVKKGDILLARTGASTGKSYLYHQKDGKLFYAGFLIKAHVLPSSDDYFIYSQTLTDRYWKWVKTASMRSGQPGINANEYASYSFAVPSLPEQRKIADCLASMDEVIQKSKDELAKWRELKKGLLQQMFV